MKEAMRALRVHAGLSQLDVACALGVQQSTVAMWESGENMPRAALLPQIAKLYGCMIDDLYGDEAKEG